MQHFRKYELTPTQWATARKKIEKTGTDPEGETYWNPDLVAVVVELGQLCLEWGTDEEGNPICINQSPNEAIDIVWVSEPLADFNAYEVLPLPVGVSSMGYTLDQEYAKHFCEVNPTHEYCLPPTPPELV
jgi:hypothetical protein